MKTTIVTATLLALTTMVSAQEVAGANTASAASSAAETVVKKYHFGFLSYEEALKSMPEYAKAMKTLDELKVKYDEEMKRAEQEFTKKYSEYIDGQKNFPENIMLKRQKELQQLMNQSIAFKNEAKEMLTKAEKDAMAPLHATLKATLKSIGEAKGYSYIINTDNDTYPFINTAEGEGEDITDIVKAALNR